MTHEDVHYTPKELLEFSNLYRPKSRNMCEMNTKCVIVVEET